MKIYNKKGFLSGIISLGLAVWSIVLDFGKPDPNTLVQIRDTAFSVLLLFIGINSLWRAFSKKATKEDLIEEQDERNEWIEYKSKSKMLDIVYTILFAIMIGGVIGIKMTANKAWFTVLVIPSFFLGLFFFIEIFVKIYYEHHE